MSSVAAAIAAAAAVTFFWRAVGALFAGRIRVDSPAFRYAFAVAYAVTAALVLKMFLYPQGAAAIYPLPPRAAGIAVALLAFYISRKNVVVASWSGVAAFAAATLALE